MLSAPRRLGVLLVLLALLLAAPAAAQASWGSIAINPETGKKGIAAGKNSAEAAKNTAKSRCGDPHCKSAVWVFNGWGATVKKKSGLYISGIGRTKAKAIANARNRANENAPVYATVFSGIG